MSVKVYNNQNSLTGLEFLKVYNIDKKLFFKIKCNFYYGTLPPVLN